MSVEQPTTNPDAGKRFSAKDLCYDRSEVLHFLDWTLPGILANTCTNPSYGALKLDGDSFCQSIGLKPAQVRIVRTPKNVPELLRTKNQDWLISLTKALKDVEVGLISPEYRAARDFSESHPVERMSARCRETHMQLERLSDVYWPSTTDLRNAADARMYHDAARHDFDEACKANKYIFTGDHAALTEWLNDLGRFLDASDKRAMEFFHSAKNSYWIELAKYLPIVDDLRTHAQSHIRWLMAAQLMGKRGREYIDNPFHHLMKIWRNGAYPIGVVGEQFVIFAPRVKSEADLVPGKAAA